MDYDPQNTWTLTDARRHFDALIGAAVRRPQMVTRYGVPSYTFAAGSRAQAKRLNADGVIIVRSIRKKGMR